MSWISQLEHRDSNLEGSDSDTDNLGYDYLTIYRVMFKNVKQNHLNYLIFISIRRVLVELLA